MMKKTIVKFHIEYKAPSSESLHLVTDKGPYQMWSTDNTNWYYEAVLPQKSSYHYELRDNDNRTLRQEAIEHRLDYNVEGVCIHDHWYDVPTNKPFYSSFFTDGVFRRKRDEKRLTTTEDYILIEVEAPTLRSDETLAITGANPMLGGWNTDSALIMNSADAPVWRVLIPAELAGSEYKFVILDNTTRQFKCFEDGKNRLLPSQCAYPTVIRGLRLRDSRAGWKGAGVAIPLFSLRSKGDWGCGEFSDLKLMAQWAAKVGMSVIQILPINDTTST